VYSTHYLEEAEYADRVLIVNDGRLVRDGTPAALKDALDASYVHLVTDDDQTAEIMLREAGHPLTRGPDGLDVPTRQPAQAVADLIVTCGVPVRSVTVHHPTLDDVFLAALLHEPDDRHPHHQPSGRQPEKVG
jgi:ABC-2 type transport system ATP-binding protein